MTMPNLLAKYYDCVAPWEKRLARELPFLAPLLPGKHVLVAGCGTGGHLPALAQRGFQVVGIDADPEMVATAASKCRGIEKARVRRLEIENCTRLEQRFDAVLCLGNVLPQFYGANRMEAALDEMYQVLAPGGLFLTQNLNYDRRWREKQRLFPLLSGRCGQEEVLIFKFADYGGTHIDFHLSFIFRENPQAGWQVETTTNRQRPVFAADLHNACQLVGFQNLRTWGSFDGEPFDPRQSKDLLLAGEK